jgi:hypothetical protein
MFLQRFTFKIIHYMARTILITAFVFSYFGVFGQNNQDTVFMWYRDYAIRNGDYITDTVIFEGYFRRNILIGTTIISVTDNQNIAYWYYGLNFIKVTRSDCQNSGGVEVEDHINSILLTDSTLIIDINITGNCSHDFLCDIAVDTMGTLILLYTGYGGRATCSCCFGLTYHLTIDKEMENISEIKAVMIGNDRKTIKQINN